MKIYIAWVTAIAVTLSSITIVASPAEARQRDRHRHHHHRGGADAGTVFAGLALFGVIAAIASSADKEKERERREREEREREWQRERDLEEALLRERERAEYYQQRFEAHHNDSRYSPPASALAAPAAPTAPTAPIDVTTAAAPTPVPLSTAAETMRRAVDACSWAAEGQAGNEARVGFINSAAAYEQGWRVTGTVATNGQADRDFDCVFQAGRVTALAIQ